MPESEDTSDSTRPEAPQARSARPAPAWTPSPTPGGEPSDARASSLDASLTGATVRNGERTTAIAGPGRSRSIAIPTRVMSIVGDTAAGVLLGQLIYWTRRGVDVIERDGWIFKTAGEWQRETGMTWKVQRRARALLLQLGLVEERKQQMPARLEFRLNLSTLAPLLAQRAQVATAPMDLVRFRDAATDDLVGRAFLFHASLTRVWPIHTAMMASRLLASARIPALDPQALYQAASRLPGGRMRLLTLQRDDWLAETGLSRDHWQTARRNLHSAGVLVERRHNFPRRVDLALDLRALADVLRHSATALGSRATADGAQDVADYIETTPTGLYRLDRAKQAVGIGNHPIPPSQSPDPAHTDRPILPAVIAQSRLYPMGLQGSLHPQPQPASEAPKQDRPMPPSLATVWGGGGIYGILKFEVQAAQYPKPAAPTAPAQPIRLLAWPRFFTDADQAQAIRHLGGLEPAIQQTVLDEIEWMQQSGKPIRSPVALARTLARSARGGTFVPDGAHRVAATRVSEEQRQQRQREAPVSPSKATEPRGPLTPEAAEARKRLSKTLDEMRRRSA